MEMNQEIVKVATELEKVLKLILNPTILPSKRMEACKVYEQFMKQSELSVYVGLYLTTSPQCETDIRYYGLKLLEHNVMCKWNNISNEKQTVIEENMWQLLLSGVGPAEDVSLSHLKHKLSTIFFEIMKNKWPQGWPNLFDQLVETCNRGDAQTELVLLIFSRFIEEVTNPTTPPYPNRKNICGTITNHISKIFVFLLELIDCYIFTLKKFTSIGYIQRVSSQSRVIETILLTLNGYLEKTTINDIMYSDGQVLNILCNLLNYSAFQITAADCLEQILKPQRQIIEKKPLQILLNASLLNLICMSAKTPATGASIEQRFLFLVKLIQVFNGLAKLIIALLDNNVEIFQQPQCFSIYIEALYTISEHLSLTQDYETPKIWIILLNHEIISKDSILLDHIPKLIKLYGPRCIREIYSGADITFEYTPGEFTLLLNPARKYIMEIFRLSTLILPCATFHYCEQWLRTILTKVNSNVNINYRMYLEWEYLIEVLDVVFNQMVIASIRAPLSTAHNLLEECLKIFINDTIIMSQILSCITKLFSFLVMSNCEPTTISNLLPLVLHKIFFVFCFSFENEVIDSSFTSIEEKEKSKIKQLKKIKNLHYHAAFLMVKLSQIIPQILLLAFDQINSTIKSYINIFPTASAESNQITESTQLMLIEVILNISNFCSKERLKVVVGEILANIEVQLMELSKIFESVECFINFVGLNRSSVEELEYDLIIKNRNIILSVLNIILTIMKCCKPPNDIKSALHGDVENAAQISLVQKYLTPTLQLIFALLKTLNTLFNPKTLCLLAEEHQMTISLLQEKPRKIKVNPPYLYNPMKVFLNDLYEKCYQIMGQAGSTLVHDQYQSTRIGDAIVSICDLQLMSSHRLESIIKIFLKSFVHSCDISYYDHVLFPIFDHLTPFMVIYLKMRWHQITKLYVTNQLTQEDIKPTRRITREYLDFLRVALVRGAVNKITDSFDQNSLIEDVTQDFNDLSINETDINSTNDTPDLNLNNDTQSHVDSRYISDLGERLLKNPITRNSIVRTIINTIEYRDKISNFRSLQLAKHVVQYLANEQLLTSTIATKCLIAVLRGLQVHGKRELNNPLLIEMGVQIYLLSYPKFPNIIEIMQRIPNIDMRALEKFTNTIEMPPNVNEIDKIKKNIFKELTSSLLHCKIELFGQEIDFVN